MDTVVVLEMNEKALQAGVDYVKNVLDKDVAKKLISEDSRNKMMKALQPTTSYASLKVLVNTACVNYLLILFK